MGVIGKLAKDWEGKGKREGEVELVERELAGVSKVLGRALWGRIWVVQGMCSAFFSPLEIRDILAPSLGLASSSISSSSN
jgi:hypothetical protein